MQALVVTSGIKRPFTPIDQSIMRALRQLNVNVTPVLPGTDLNKRLVSCKANYKPDFILVLMAWRLTKQNWTGLNRVQHIPKVAWFTDDPYYMDWSRKVGKRFDAVFTNESQSVAVYRQNGCGHVHHLPLGVDTTDFFPRQFVPGRYRSDVLVLGTAFNNRNIFVRRLLPHLTGVKVRLVGPGWEKLRLYRRKNVMIRPEWVPVKEANAYYNGAKIVLNLHRSPRDEYLQLNRGNVPADTPNNRTFEVAGCSAFQLVEARSGLHDLYTPETSIPTFHSFTECLKMINYYLPRAKQRASKARSAYEHTLRFHQYTHRLQKIVDYVRDDQK